MSRNINLTELAVGTIRDKPLHDRMRWWADLNANHLPADFPVQLEPSPKPGEPSERLQKLWTAVGDTLTFPECSLGWWIYELKKTSFEWAVWWQDRGVAFNTVERYLKSRYGTTVPPEETT